MDLGRPLLWRVNERLRAEFFMFVLCLFGGLPEEQVRADRRPQHRDDRDDIVLLPGNARHEGAVRDFAPRHVDDENSRDIGEERERRPFEDRGIALVAREYLEPRAEDRKEDNVEMCRSANDEVQRITHGRATPNSAGEYCRRCRVR